MKPITIIGGGLAGLSLGIALRKFEVPVTIREAGRYPRHRVCGEFLSGVTTKTLATLGISESLRDCVINCSTGWYRRNRLIIRRELPEPAWGLSRLRLDFRLADLFERSGGTLRTGERAGEREIGSVAEGVIHSFGKRSDESQWLGLKIHIRNLPALPDDLQMHLGDRAYAGISRIEENRHNLCCLFHRRAGIKGRGMALIIAYLRASGMGELSEALEAGEPCEASFSAASGFSFSARKRSPRGRILLGDAAGMIPPFTGNGMSLALESAETALPHVLSYSRGELTWSEAGGWTNRDMDKRFRRRRAAAVFLQAVLTNGKCQALLSTLASRNLLPFERLYFVTRR